jgi:GDP-L-fucose synthase
MKIYVAGHRGLVGSATVRQIEKESKHVFVGQTRSELDLLNRDAVFSYLSKEKPDAIIIAAAKVGGIQANKTYPVEFLSQNLQIETNLIDGAHAAGLEKLLFLGSSCVYPKFAQQPIREEYLLTGELEKTNSAYAVAKIAGLELVKSYRKEYGYHWITAMPTNLYGPNDNFDLETSHVLPALIRKFVDGQKNNSSQVILWGTGKPLREFLHVDDLAKAILTCLDKYDSSEHINIGSGEEISINELANKISKAAGYKGEIVWDSTKPDGTPRKVLDITKVKSLGWKPSITLDQGIASTVGWYQSNVVI